MQIDYAHHPVLQEALYVVKRLEEAGHAAYFVGGAVRDVLLGRSIQDVDIATSALPEETLKLFPKVYATGLQHGTVTVEHEKKHYEVTTFRVETAYVDFRRPEQVEFVQNLKLDLARRDFTMNAMALNANGTLVDYFGGLAALESKQLIAVGNPEQRLQEDALRMVRAVRFAAVYQLSCDELLWTAIERLRPLLRHISMERISLELFKLLKHTKQLSSLELLYRSELMLYTKRQIHLQQVLAYWFEQEDNSLLHTNIVKAELLWAILYGKSHLSEESIGQDFNALVFSKKLSTDIKTYIKWIRFFDYTVQAYNSEQTKEHYIHTYNELIIDYCSLTGNNMSEIKQEDQLELIFSMYWYEQCLLYSHLDYDDVEPLLLYFDYTQHRFQLENINKQQTIYKLTELKLTGKACSKLLNREAGPWLKRLLKLLYFAVNLKLVKNDEQALSEYIFQLEHDGVIG